MHHKFSITQKFSASAALALVLFGAISSLVLFSSANSLAEQSAQNKGSSSLNYLVELVRSPLVNRDVISAQAILQNAISDSLIFSTELKDANGVLLAQSRRQDGSPRQVLQFQRDIEFQGAPVGTINIAVNHSSIQSQYRQPIFVWLLLWTLFSAVFLWLVYRASSSYAARIHHLLERLPGTADGPADEVDALEHRVLPLLAKTAVSEETFADQFHYCVFTAHIKNRPALDLHLDRAGRQKMLVQIDYCTARTLELYGGQRLHGNAEHLRFFIRSPRFSKQQLLVSLMAAHTLQQLLQKLAEQMGVQLEVAWGLSMGDVVEDPLMLRDQQFDELSNQSNALAETLGSGNIALAHSKLDPAEFSSVAELRVSDGDYLLLEKFPVDRQDLLDRQLHYLCTTCL